MNSTFMVASSHGHLIVDAATGNVLRCYSSGNEEDNLPSIFSFDVNRYKQTFKVDSMPSHIDILRLGYTTQCGAYEPPEPDYEDPNHNFED